MRTEPHTACSPSRPRLLVAVALFCLTSVQAHAAGGHFAVDDAAILDPGACKLDAWFSRSPGDSRLLHAGGACRVGPVELGAGADHERHPGGSQTEWGLGVKWATPVTDAFSIGASLGPAGRRGQVQGATAMALLSWAATDRLALHANLGRDLLRGGDDQLRGGVSAAWNFREAWTAIVERFRADGGHFVRAGLRWEPAAGWTVDFSRADPTSGTGSASWTLGASRELERR